MAAADLTTLADVKSWLGLTDPAQTTDDDLLATLITAASAFIRSWTGRDLTEQTYTEIRDGMGSARLPMYQTPVTVVSAVAIDGVTIPQGDGVGAPGYFWTGSELRLHGYLFRRGLGNVRITYTAGYAVVPADLQRACVELVGYRFREQGRIGLASKGMAGETTTYLTRDVPPSVASVLDRYKRVVPLC